ncbi:MAG: GNAT family N-acetyltransferase [Actinomycetota bacterium]|nr:GNAT family N-acetyltransferase [Actinomycetota bacterium]MDH4353457.1 GNAT family N-acetyltransferase [Actinomycetota bacterium]
MTLTEWPVGVRPIRRRDAAGWRDVRRENRDWLRPWDATPPQGSSLSPTFGAMVASLLREARAGRALPFVITVEGRLVGQLTVGGIAYGSLRAAHLGYWVDRRVAGRGVTPTAVALVGDHCFGVLGLHRLEIALRGENDPSRRVAQKLGFRFEGERPRYLHIDGDWRDHEIWALHADEVPEGLLERWRRSRHT